MTEHDVEKFVADALYTGPSVGADQLIGVESCLHQLAGQLALIARPELVLGAARFINAVGGTKFPSLRRARRRGTPSGRWHCPAPISLF